MKTIEIFFISLVLLFSGCLAEPEEVPITTDNPHINFTAAVNTTFEPEPEPILSEIVNEKAYDFAKSSSTYAYDGSDLELDGYDEDNEIFTFTYTYKSRYSGFGDRTQYVLGLMETKHTLNIVFFGEELESVVLDNVYDEIKEELIDVAKNIDLSPTDREQSKEIAIEFAKETEELKQNARSGSPVWVDDIDIDKITDTTYKFIVRFETDEPYGANSYRKGEINVVVNRYEPFVIDENFPESALNDWYLDPTGTYDEVNVNIPDPKCPPGQLIAVSRTMKFCYTPTATHELPCSSDAQCDKGACMRTSMGDYGPPAKCKDYPYGCRYWLFEDKLPALVCMD